MAVTQTNDNGEGGGVNVGASLDLGINPAQYRDQILGLMTVAETKSVRHTCPMRTQSMV